MLSTSALSAMKQLRIGQRTVLMKYMGGGTGGRGRGDRSPANFLASNIMPMGVAWKESTSKGPCPLQSSRRGAALGEILPEIRSLDITLKIRSQIESHSRYGLKKKSGKMLIVQRLGIPNFVTIGQSVRELLSENPKGLHQPPVPAMVNMET